MFPLIWWVWEHILTEDKKPGRKVQAEALEGHGEFLIRQKEKDLDRRRGRRVAADRRGRRRPAADRGRRGARRRQRHLVHRIRAGLRLDRPARPGLVGPLASERGCVTGQPGLYVLGQEFQYMFNSHTVGGVGKDAAYVVGQLASRRMWPGRELEHVLACVHDAPAVRPAAQGHPVDDRQHRAAVAARDHRPARPGAGRGLRARQATRSARTPPSSAGSTEPTGVLATDDIDALLALGADACCYNPLWPSIDELVALLESGVNVCSSAAWITGGKQSPEDQAPDPQGLRAGRQHDLRQRRAPRA